MLGQEEEKESVVTSSFRTNDLISDALRSVLIETQLNEVSYAVVPSPNGYESQQ